ncbi:uncharacterized protein LOC133806090 [Humulus lupulus]|uniref:uncharacterized protein LOC133806090 n=1 Tax=Humulus lupulus TaxID=3486 RepID=UPI002B41254D|nr:uncharacterized protein LOC133806090 [Humulus lupulus]
MTSNIVESLNALNLAAREFPITTLLECLYGLLQECTYTNRKNAQNTFTKLTPIAEEKMTKNYIYSLRLTVKPSNEYLFEVVKEEKSWIVNLKDQTCTCNKFQMDEMPCGHALSMMKEIHLDPYVYCSDYYTTKTWLQTYEAIVYPVGNQRTWDVPNYIKEIIILPSDARVKTWRPKKRRIRAAWETKMQNRCSRCGQRGHNRKACQNKPINI